MVSKVLAWSALALAMLFAILAGTAIFAFGREAPDAETARRLFAWGAMPLLGVALALAVALLVAAAFTSDSDS